MEEPATNYVKPEYSPVNDLKSGCTYFAHKRHFLTPTNQNQTIYKFYISTSF